VSRCATNILLGASEHAVNLDRVVHAAVLERDMIDLEDVLDGSSVQVHTAWRA